MHSLIRALGRRLLALFASTVVLAGCAGGPPELQALDQKIEVERFMGDWYVLASIPIDFPFFSEAEAHDAVESYRLEENGEIDITYRYRDGGFDVEPRVVKQRGWIHDQERGTEWRVQLLWPFRSAYLIAWLNEDYTRAIVGVPSRRYVWLLSRQASVPESEMADLTRRIAELGHDTSLLRQVPQRPADD